MVGILMLTMAVVVLVACASGDSSSGNNSGTTNDTPVTITISGSTSVGPLAEKLAEKYKAAHSNVTIEINQVGSSAGITNAIDGVSQIGMSSRDIKDEEKASGLEELVIAYDGIAVAVNANNGVKELTLDQVKQIFTGEITNWKEVGGDDLEIVVVSREDGSGSRDAFQEKAGFESEELIENAIIANGNGNIKTTVAGNKQAIGYVSLEYIDDSISTINIDNVEPTAANIIAGTYKISRPFIFVYKSDVADSAKKFMDYILSDEGQAVVEESGAIKLDK